MTEEGSKEAREEEKKEGRREKHREGKRKSLMGRQMSGQVDKCQMDGWIDGGMEGLRQERIDGQEKIIFS